MRLQFSCGRRSRDYSTKLLGDAASYNCSLGGAKQQSLAERWLAPAADSTRLKGLRKYAQGHRVPIVALIEGVICRMIGLLLAECANETDMAPSPADYSSVLKWDTAATMWKPDEKPIREFNESSCTLKP